MLSFQKMLRFFLLVSLIAMSLHAAAQVRDSASPDSLFQAARKAAFDSNDYPRAKAYLFKALQKSPNYADIRIFLGRIYTWTKVYDSGRIAFRQVLAKNPNYEDALVAYADLEYYTENFERALEICRGGLKNNLTSEALMVREVKILKAMNRFDEAERSEKKLLLNSTNKADPKVLTNNSRDEKNKNSEIERSPLPVKAGLDAGNSDSLFAAARKAAVDSNNYPLVKAYLLKALRIRPDYTDARVYLGRIYTLTRNYDSGRIALRQVLDKQPDYEDAVLAYTDLEYVSGNYERALELCKTGLRNNPASEAMMLRQAKILNALNRFDEADRTVQKLLMLNGNNVEAKNLANSFREPKNKSSTVTQPTVPAKKIAGDTSTSDGLLAMARKAAFDDKNYAQAKQYLYHALQISPGYADIKIFLGRLNTWTDNKDSARYYFKEVLKTNPGYEDASAAYADLEYWNDNTKNALTITDSALLYHPASADLLVRKAKILSNLRRYTEANTIVLQALKIDRNNSIARSLAERIKELSTKNKIGLNYDYIYFDKQFSDPWHLASFDYTRRTGIGAITGRINYANRFKQEGVQYELEGYPRISKTFYSYINAGYSEKVGVFPQWRGGFSLYVNLPKSYEADLGFRYLKFSGSPTWIYTGYLGKYYKSWLFGARTYITPSKLSNAVSTSYSVSARYYYGSTDDYFGVSAGYGISPDDRINSIQIDSKVNLVSYRAGLNFKKKVSKFTVISINGSWINQEYLPQTKGNQYQFGLGWIRRF